MSNCHQINVLAERGPRLIPEAHCTKRVNWRFFHVILWSKRWLDSRLHVQFCRYPLLISPVAGSCYSEENRKWSSRLRDSTQNDTTWRGSCLFLLLTRGEKRSPCALFLDDIIFRLSVHIYDDISLLLILQSPKNIHRSKNTNKRLASPWRVHLTYRAQLNVPQMCLENLWPSTDIFQFPWW